MSSSLRNLTLLALLAGLVTVLAGRVAPPSLALLTDSATIPSNTFTTGCWGTFGQDSFTGTNGTGLSSHTPEVGAAWIALNDDGVAIIDTNNVTTTSSTEILWRVNVTACDSSYAVSLDSQTGSSVSGRCVGPAGRLVDVNNYYRARLCGDGIVTLEKVVSGAVTSLGTYTISSFSTTTFYTIKLELTDAAKKVYVNGTQQISSSDNALTSAGKPGIRHEGGATMRGDNFLAAQVP